ncbi:MAG: hypothetical protein HY063_00715 [Bacteroidetes bacterium]|nr:hypothetical protein [Bacteroidota bacterium]
MKTKILIVAALAFASIASFAQKKEAAPKKEKDKVLVNKVFTVEFTETSAKKPKPIADEISFKGEKLNSKFMTSENKLPAAAYTVSVDSSSSSKDATFQSSSKNPDGDEVKWDGTVSGESIEGTAVITTKKGKTIEYSFTGNLKAKPGKK